MLETLSATTEDVSSKKRGRKTVNVNYFDVREEDAVRSFLLAETSEEKNKISHRGIAIQKLADFLLNL